MKDHGAAADRDHPAEQDHPADPDHPATPSRPRRPRTGRGRVPLLLVLGVALLAGGALTRWWTVEWVQPLQGPRADGVTGRQAAPALLALALVAVAGLGAAAAVRGVGRRLIGVLIAATGVGGIVAVVLAVTEVPESVIREAHPQVERVLGGTVQIVGPLICGLGAVALLAGGLLVLGGRFGGRGMGDRFDRTPVAAAAAAATSAPGRPAVGPAAHPAPDASAAADADAATLWKQLDAGADPTERTDGRS